MLLIFFLGVFFRIWRFSSVPPGLHYDEASFAYNAWSILETGRDEFGKFLPLNFRAFDDFRPPLYVYLTSISIFIFGVNDFSLKLPSLLSGILLLPVLYLLSKELFSPKIGRWTFVLASFNPTLILMSRTAYDANLALFLSTLSFWLFLKSLKKQQFLFLLGSLFLGTLAILTYQSSKVFVPLMFLALIIIYLENFKKLVFKNKNWLVLGLSVLIMGLPVVSAFLYQGSLQRFTTISVFDQEALNKIAALRETANNEQRVGFLNFLANRRFLYLEDSVSKFLDNFHPTYLFAPVLYPTIFQIPNFSYFHLLTLILLIIGIPALFSQKDKKAGWFIVCLIFLGVLPTAFVASAPKITRVLPLVIGILLIASWGWQKIWEKLPAILVIGYGFSIVLLFYSLFWLFPRENAKFWQGNYRQLVDKTQELKPAYDKVFVSNSLELPYIFFLWYGRIDPKTYLPQGGTQTGNILAADNQFAGYIFKKFNQEDFENNSNALFVGVPSDFQGWGSQIGTLDCDSNNNQCVWFIKK